MTASPVFPTSNHDHEHCVATILAYAERLCRDQSVRLTDQRRRVLGVVAQSHAAIGAYEIMERLAAGGKRPAPISVYRALDFLMAQGLVHRLASLNAYVACLKAGPEHGAQFLICRRCGTIGEMTDAAVARAIAGAAGSQGFEVTAPVVEIAGLCRQCHDGA